MTHGGDVMEKIRLYRERKKLSQREFAQALGISQSAVAQWENGSTVPTLDNLVRAAGILGCEVGDLVPKSKK